MKCKNSLVPLTRAALIGAALVTAAAAQAQAQAQVRKHFGLVLSSNHLNPILIEATDRRYFVPVFSKHQSHQGETKAFYQRFADRLISEGGLQIM